MSSANVDMECQSTTYKRRLADDNDDSSNVSKVKINVQCDTIKQNHREPAIEQTNSQQQVDFTNLCVLIKATKAGRQLRSYNPLVVSDSLKKLIGECESTRPLPSGDLLVKCVTTKQFSALIACNNLGNASTSIPVKTEKYLSRDFSAQCVIKHVPEDLTDNEIACFLAKFRVVQAKRLKRKTSSGFELCSTVLLNFSTNIVPSTVEIGYLRFKTHEYNPPPIRCFNCNRYGHIGKHCRG
ncbi:uncharacterized protein LOC144427410 [Styela clava]